MSDLYVNLGYEEYKRLERACRAFAETEHGKGTDYYHKSIRLPVGDTLFEFHGPNVQARQTVDINEGAVHIAKQCEDQRKHPHHEWIDEEDRVYWCSGCAV